MLVAAYKPPFVSSNAYLSKLKKHFKIQKGGYLGTLDPFARGTLVVGFGSYTRLFVHLAKTPKVYRATLWLGAKSRSLDIEHIQSVEITKMYPQEQIEQILSSMKGKITYSPPSFSAKHINGKRAYELARIGKDFTLPKVDMTIYYLKLLLYSHPFVSFEASVSEGAYIRSIGEMIAQKLGVYGALSSLERLSEGLMSVSEQEGLKILNPLDYLPYKRLKNNDMSRDDIYHGKKIICKDIQKGKYIVCFEDFFSIIEVYEDGSMEYLLNRIAHVNSFT